MPYVAQLVESDRIVPRLVKEVETVSGNSPEPWTAARGPARQIGIVLFEGFSLLRAGIVAEGVHDVRLRLRGPLRLARVGFSG